MIDTEYIGLKYSSTGVIFEAAFLLLDEQRPEVYSYKWNIKYNTFKYDKKKMVPNVKFYKSKRLLR